MKFTFLNLKNLFWILAVFLSLSCLIYYSHGAYDKWNINPDIGTTSHLIPSSEIPFPAITFCQAFLPQKLQWKTIEPWNYLMKILDNYEVPKLSSYDKNFAAVLLQVCVPQSFSPRFSKELSNRTEIDVLKLLLHSSYPAYPMTIKFRFVYSWVKWCFTQTFTEYGLCDSFNMLGYHTIFNMENLHDDFKMFKRENKTKFPYFAMEKSIEYVDDENEIKNWTLQDGYSTKETVYVQPYRAVKKNELKIVYNMSHSVTMKEKYYFYCIFFGRGFKAILHLSNEIPTPFHKEIFLKEHHETRIILNAEKYTTKPELRRFSPEVRQCYFDGERKLKFFKSYTKNHCDYECLTNYTLEQCGCVKFSMPRSQNTPVCDIDKIECFDYAIKNWPVRNNLKKTVIACDCYPPCNDIKYSYKTAIEAEPRFNEAFTKTRTSVNFEFASHVIQEHEKYVAYTLQNFVADCGGLIGLFLGFSLLSIFEFAYEMVEKLIKSKKNKVEDKKSGLKTEKNEEEKSRDKTERNEELKV